MTNLASIESNKASIVQDKDKQMLHHLEISKEKSITKILYKNKINFQNSGVNSKVTQASQQDLFGPHDLSISNALLKSGISKNSNIMTNLSNTQGLKFTEKNFGASNQPSILNVHSSNRKLEEAPEES